MSQQNLSTPFSFPPSGDFDGNAGSWSSFIIGVGTPSQYFKIFPSTNGQQTWVPVPEGCTPDDPSNCGSLRGVLPMNQTPSTGFETNQSSTWKVLGIYQLDTETSLNLTGNGEYGLDTVSLGQDPTSLALTQQLVAGVATKDYYLGELGLGPKPASLSGINDSIPSFMTNLADQNLIPSLSFGYTAGAKYHLNGTLGSLTLGGYDVSRIVPGNLTIPFGSNDSRSLLVGVQSISATNTLAGVVAPLTTPILALVDSSISDIWLPLNVCQAFEQAFGLTYDPSTGLYLVNSSMHERLQQLNPSLNFKIGATIDSIPFVDISMPYKAFDLQANYPIYPNATDYFPLRRAMDESQYTLGRTFLQEAYITVDYERSNFSIAQAVFQNPNTPRILPILPTKLARHVQHHQTEGLDHSAIAGITVASVSLSCIVLAFGMCILHRNRKRQKRIGNSMPGGTGTASYGAELDDDKVYQQNPGWSLELPDSQIARTPQELSGTPRQDRTLGSGPRLNGLEEEQSPLFELPSPLHNLSSNISEPR